MSFMGVGLLEAWSVDELGGFCNYGKPFLILQDLIQEF